MTSENKNINELAARLEKFVSIRIEARPGTGKTALGTVIEKTLRDAGVNVMRAPHEEIVDLDFEASLAVLGEMTDRGIQVGLSEHHLASSGAYLNYKDQLHLDAPMAGYAKIWHNGRVLMAIEPMRALSGGGWKPVFLDEISAKDIPDIRFTISLFDAWPVGRVVARFGLGQFPDTVAAARDYLLVWIQAQQLNPLNAPFERDYATWLVRRGNELLSEVISKYVSDTSLVDNMYPDVLKVNIPTGVDKTAQQGRVKIFVEGPGNSGKTAMVLLIAEMLDKIGLSATRTRFNSPAPEVLGMDHDMCIKILRDIGPDLQIDVSSVDLPRA